ncbi:HEAT repeat domain-containing protein [Kitasatospora sp. NPDC088346]|uniref:HEAT repeat domain-containing protein n=1 Tax=Kitasatospora sp. NPDC088346 TaxID=3364073 RepID=UPI0038287469
MPAPEQVHRAAGVALVRVTAAERITPRMLRVTFGGLGPDALPGHWPDQQVKLCFPRPGQAEPRLPAADPDGDVLRWYQAFLAIPEDERPWMRGFTVRARRPARGEIDVDFVLHGDDDPAARTVGCRLLRRAGNRHAEVRAGAATGLLALFPAERDRTVRDLAVHALAATQDERAVPLLVALAEDPDPGIRQAVAESLAHVAPDLPNEPEVAALIRLTTDPEPEVRNWAAFALGFQLPVDTPAVRAALWARTTDDHPEARGEGIRGLAVRHDPRAVPLLADLLEWSEGDPLSLRAAAVLGAPALLPRLRALDPRTPGLDEALAACDPVARRHLDDRAWALLEDVQRRLPEATAALSAERFEPGLDLTVTTADGPLHWSVGPLLARADGSLARAVELVLTDIATE